MKTPLTFKQYLDSKARLIEAVKNNPQQTIQYNICKYCRLVVGESKDNKTHVNLKPNQTILVEWAFDDPSNPIITGVKFENVSDINPNTQHNVFWPTERLQRWLTRNTHD